MKGPTNKRIKESRAAQTSDGMRKDYDLTGGARGKYVSRFAVYRLVRDAETGLHDFIKLVLTKELGAGEWWRKGIPVKVRKERAARREEDEDGEGLDRYAFTDTIHLSEILDSKWAYFAPYAKGIDDKSDFKKRLLSEISRMNRISRAVMHPVRKIELTQEDFHRMQLLNGIVRRFFEVFAEASGQEKAGDGGA